MEFLLLLVLLVLVGVALRRLNHIRRIVEQLPEVEARLLQVERHVRALRAEPVRQTSAPPLPAVAQAVSTAPGPAFPAVATTQPPHLPVAMTGPSSEPAAEPGPPPVPRVAFSLPAGPAAPAEPEPVPAWVESASSVLRRIGQWLLVGEEFRPAGVSFEFAAATTWLVRVGILALVAGVGYFLKWSIEQGVLGPAARVAISAAFGMALLASGYRLLGKRYHLLGEAFLGGGIATLYFSTYALGPLYRLVSSNLAVFGLMTLVTVAAGVLALSSKSLLVAIVGIIGGFCTPLLLRTSSPQLAILYGYLLLLNLGILSISRRHGWRLLNYLGFLFTYGIFAYSLQDYARKDFGVAITFLTLFFLVHSSLVFSHNLR